MLHAIFSDANDRMYGTGPTLAEILIATKNRIVGVWQSLKSLKLI
jgi:hypothetical protein